MKSGLLVCRRLCAEARIAFQFNLKLCSDLVEVYSRFNPAGFVENVSQNLTNCITVPTTTSRRRRSTQLWWMRRKVEDCLWWSSNLPPQYLVSELFRNIGTNDDCFEIIMVRFHFKISGLTLHTRPRLQYFDWEKKKKENFWFRLMFGFCCRRFEPDGNRTMIVTQICLCVQYHHHHLP